MLNTVKKADEQGHQLPSLVERNPQGKATAVPTGAGRYEDPAAEARCTYSDAGELTAHTI